MKNQGGHVSGLSVAQVIQQGAGACGRASKYKAFESVNVDPTVAGLDRAVGSIVVFRDGSLSWIKYSVAATAWRSVSIQGTNAQNEALFYGDKSVVSASVLEWASLANGQTFITITPAGAVNSRTIDMVLAASTDRPTFCAALAAMLNMVGTTAYTWAVNTASPVDGLIGTAKSYGSAYDVAPTGTALVDGVGDFITYGAGSAVSRTPETIAVYTPGVAAASKDFAFASAAWRELLITFTNCGSAANGDMFMRADGAESGLVTANQQINATVTTSSAVTAFVCAQFSPFVDISGGVVRMYKMASGRFFIEATSHIKTDASTVKTVQYIGSCPGWSTFLRLAATGQVFRVGSTVKIIGWRA